MRSDTLAMTASHEPFPRARGTVKGLAWKLLYANHRAALGPEGWTSLTAAAGAPVDVKTLDLAEDLPVAPFNATVEHLARAVGTDVRGVGVRAAERWGAMHRALARELQGRPGRALEVLCREVYPWLVAEPGAARVVAADAAGAVVVLGGGLDPAFRVGLAVGFARVAGADADATVEGDRIVLSWAPVRTGRPSPARLLFDATRARLVPVTLLPILLGTALAWWHGALDPLLAAAALGGAVALHLAANTLNDVIDARRDAGNLTPTPFSGGSRVIQRGLLSSRAMLALTLGLAIAGVGTGLALAWAGGLPVLGLGAIGVALAVAYTAPPLRLSHRGLGEAAAALVFGPLLAAGAYAVQRPVIQAEALLAGLPIGALMAAFLLTSELPDAPWDARTGKRTLAVRLGERAPWGVATALAFAYLCIALLVVRGVLPAPTLLALCAAPLALVVTRRVLLAHGDADALGEAQPWVLALHATTGLLLVAGIALEVLA